MNLNGYVMFHYSLSNLVDFRGEILNQKFISESNETLLNFRAEHCDVDDDPRKTNRK